MRQSYNNISSARLERIDAQIDRTCDIATQIVLALMFLVAGIVCAFTAIVIIGLKLFAGGLKLLLRVVVSRPIVSQAFALAGVC